MRFICNLATAISYSKNTYSSNLAIPQMRSVDNSCNSFAGYYLYIETSSPRARGDKAIILTPYLNGPHCFKFSYHMYGEDIGSLNIFAKNQTIFSKFGNQGNQWVSVQTPILQTGKYMVSQ